MLTSYSQIHLMRVFVLAIFLMTFSLSACGSKSRNHRKIPLKTLEADVSIEVDSSPSDPVDRNHVKE